jgi:DNA-binding NarL/FixJ family response regulator
VFILSPLPALRAGLRAMLAGAPAAIEVVGDAASIEDAPEVLPEVWLVSDAEQLPALAARLSSGPAQSVVVMSSAMSALNALSDVPIGGVALVPADVQPAELQAAVHAAAQGMLVMPYRAGRDALSISASNTGHAEAIEQPLTPRELDVLERVSRGLPSKMIAQQLDVAESTIKFHLSSIYAKLAVSTRTEAVSKAARLGLITL